MDPIRQILERSEPLVLFLAIALGYLLGQVRVFGFQLGVAGVLFVGLAFGAWSREGGPPLTIAHQVTEIGLILFVYAVGLTSGPGFFASLRQRGLRFNLPIVVALLAGAATALLLGRAMGLSAEKIAGVYCGGLTNTPALAAVLQLVQSSAPERAADPTLGYSISYPFAVFGSLLAFGLVARLQSGRLRAEQERAAAAMSGERRVVAVNYEIANPALFGRAIGELRVQEQTGMVISRVRHDGKIFVPTKYTLLHEGDVITAVGTAADAERARAYFGRESREHLEFSRESIEMRRVLMSNRKLVGRTLEELELDRRFNAQVTRLRRADIDMVPSPDTTLELGDRLRVVMPRDKVGEVSRYFGDSERDIAELDYTAITLGLSLGVLIGLIPLPLPGGGSLSLGFAGGPLLAGLVLGKLGRSGPIVWNIPLEANHALRHIGLLFFLAGVGVAAGSRLLTALSTDGWLIFLLGALVTVVTTTLALLLLQGYGKTGVIATLGATAGMQTQPATLARAYELSRSDEVYVAYATTYPVAMVGKILIAQLLVILGRLL